MRQDEFLVDVIARLERANIEYIVTGSMASSNFGEFRFTDDLDIVIYLLLGQIKLLIQQFPLEDFYLSVEAIKQAIQHKGMFNAIHQESIHKVDFIVADNSPFNQIRFKRAVTRAIADDVSAKFSSPEDIILKKLEFYKLGQSSKHIRDITSMLMTCDIPIDRKYIAKWAVRLDVSEQWDMILSKMKPWDNAQNDSK